MAWPAMSVTEAHARLTAPGSPFEIETAIIRGQPLRIWKHAPASNREVVEAAREHGERTFLVYEDERVSFAAFHRAVCALATELLAHGLRKGDRVTIAMRNLPEWPVVFYAASVAGGIVAPLNAWWSADELQYAINDCGARFAFLDDERLQRLGERLSTLRTLEQLFVCRASNEISRSDSAHLEDLIGRPRDWASLPQQAMPNVTLDPEDDATIFYTSGTSGRTKGALGTHRNMLCNITGAECAAARTRLRRGEPAEVAHPAAQAGALVTVPFFHVTGCFAILSPALYAGSKLVLIRRWDPASALQLIEHERLTGLVCVPAIPWQLIEHPMLPSHDLSSLVSIGYGGAAAAPELMRRIAEVLPAAVPGHGWGMTETSGLTTTHSAEDYAHRPLSCGAAVPVCDLKIMSPDGMNELAVGETGELWVRGPNIVKGYWNHPKETLETFVDGWLRTGDLARLDAEGFCYIVDRIKDVVIRGGENIYCVEVENTLYEHPAVVDAAVLGRPHRILGEEPIAVVHLANGQTATEEALRAHVAARLAAYKVPVSIAFWPELLPRNANGKIVKSELRRRLL